MGREANIATQAGLQKAREISRSAAFREALDTYHRPVSTAPMGKPGDGRSMVNKWGKVHVDNLGVIDASMIPEIPTVPTT